MPLKIPVTEQRLDPLRIPEQSGRPGAIVAQSNEALTEGAERFGLSVAEYGLVSQKRQEEHQDELDRAAAMEANRLAGLEVNQFEAEAEGRKGKDAIGFYSESQSRLKAIRDKYTGTLTSEKSKQYFGERFGTTEVAVDGWAAKYEARETDTYKRETASSEAGLLIEQAKKVARTDPELSRTLTDMAMQNIAVANKGAPAGIVEGKQLVARSKLNVDVVDSYLTDEDVDGAMRHLEANKDTMTQGDYDAAKTRVENSGQWSTAQKAVSASIAGYQAKGAASYSEADETALEEELRGTLKGETLNKALSDLHARFASQREGMAENSKRLVNDAFGGIRNAKTYTEAQKFIDGMASQVVASDPIGGQKTVADLGKWAREQFGVKTPELEAYQTAIDFITDPAGAKYKDAYEYYKALRNDPDATSQQIEHVANLVSNLPDSPTSFRKESEQDKREDRAEARAQKRSEENFRQLREMHRIETEIDRGGYKTEQDVVEEGRRSGLSLVQAESLVDYQQQGGNKGGIRRSDVNAWFEKYTGIKATRDDKSMAAFDDVYKSVVNSLPPGEKPNDAKIGELVQRRLQEMVTVEGGWFSDAKQMPYGEAVAQGGDYVAPAPVSAPPTIQEERDIEESLKAAGLPLTERNKAFVLGKLREQRGE